METPSPFPCLISAIRLGLTIKQKGNGFSVSLFSYANTKILIVTCYLLLQGLERCCASILPPLQVPFYSHSKERTWNGLEAKVKRTWNGITTESQRTHDGTASEGLPEHFSRLYIVFQAYRKPEIMLVVMLLRLSAVS